MLDCCVVLDGILNVSKAEMEHLLLTYLKSSANLPLLERLEV